MTWTFDPAEPCVCGHPGSEHCPEDECCTWSYDDGEWGGRCFAVVCDCTTYRPRSLHEGEQT
jgi:hypothetical protein